MHKKKLTKRERKAQREAADRRRFYGSTVVRCFLCGTWQQVEPGDVVWGCCCGAGGSVDGGFVETMTMSEFLVDDWTDRIARFWISEGIEKLGIEPGSARAMRRSANPALLFAATVEIWDHFSEGCDCLTDGERAVANEVPDLQRVDWYTVSDVVHREVRSNGRRTSNKEDERR